MYLTSWSESSLVGFGMCVRVELKFLRSYRAINEGLVKVLVIWVDLMLSEATVVLGCTLFQYLYIT